MKETHFFRSSSIPKPYTSPDDVFCLCETRMTDGYGRISRFNHQIRDANVPIRIQVDAYLVPDLSNDFFLIGKNPLSLLGLLLEQHR